MNRLTKTLLSAGLAVMALTATHAPSLADGPIAHTQTAGQAAFEADRQTILAVAGDFKVTCDMQESTAWMAGYTPLDRRDAIRNPVYDRYVGINRHQLTPTGWIHRHDNNKLMPAKNGSGDMVPVAQEYVLNTCERFDGCNASAADAYWAKTKGCWDAVRRQWDAVAEANGGIRVEQEASVGTAIADERLILADQIKDGKADPD